MKFLSEMPVIPVDNPAECIYIFVSVTIYLRQWILGFRVSFHQRSLYFSK